MNNKTEYFIDPFILNGWTRECKSPLEIRHSDGSFATLNAADMISHQLKSTGEHILWLDDMRNPLQHLEYINEMIDGDSISEITWVKDYDGFVEFYKIQYDLGNRLPSVMFFDHDLAPEHYAPEEVWDNYVDYKNWFNQQRFTARNGFQTAKWFQQFKTTPNVNLPSYIKVFSQSANPYGKQNILNLIF